MTDFLPQLWLQMITAEPKSRFAVIYAGVSFLIAERRECPSKLSLWHPHSHCAVLDVYEDGARVLRVSPVYSVFAEECKNMPPTPGGPASIMACLMAFACSNLEGFEIAPPPPLPSPLPAPTIHQVAGDLGKGARQGGELSSDHNPSLYLLRRSTPTAGGGISQSPSSLGPPFDQFGIHQKLLDFSVRAVLF